MKEMQVTNYSSVYSCMLTDTKSEVLSSPIFPGELLAFQTGKETFAFCFSFLA